MDPSKEALMLLSGDALKHGVVIAKANIGFALMSS
jgi:hypothetical protein